MGLSLEIIIGIGIIVGLYYYYFKSKLNFWKSRNVIGPKPIPILGNFLDVLLGNIHVSLWMKRYYDEYDTEPMVGVLGLNEEPWLILRDPDLIKDVLIKDFNMFPDRGFYINPKTDPLNQNLLNLEHDRWRPLRSKLSPVFTAGKLKEMFYLVSDCARHFEQYLEQLSKKNEPVEVRELTAKFTTQTIGACAFGLDTKALDDADSDFRKFGRALFNPGFSGYMKRFLQDFFPRIYELMGLKLRTDAHNFFIETMRETLEYRKKSNTRRNDFVDLMMDLQSHPEKLTTIDFNEMFLTGQALVFFAAGFETSSTTISNTLYELALHHDIQDSLRREITQVVESNGGKLTYESIKDMKFLDKVVKETLRKYPPGSFLRREASNNYTFAGTKTTIPKGTKVFIPVWAIHRDPQIYTDPDRFDPERFDGENDKTLHPMNYLPFGDGPHNCIGLRFAKLQTKFGIIAMMRKFKVDVCDKTLIPYRIEPRPLIPTPIGGIYLKISKC